MDELGHAITLTFTGGSHDLKIELFDQRRDSTCSVGSAAYASSLETHDEEDEDVAGSLGSDSDSISTMSTLSDGIPRRSVSFKSCRSYILEPETRTESQETSDMSSRPTKSRQQNSRLAPVSALPERTPNIVSAPGKREKKECERSVTNNSHSSIVRHPLETSRSQEVLREPALTVPKIVVGPLHLEPTRLEAITEVDSDSATSTDPSPTMPIQNSPPLFVKRQTWLLDRFGRAVWLHYNSGEGIEEVRVDEDGNYYVFGPSGLRVKLGSGQIRGDDTSQPYCICKGEKVNIRVVPDRIRVNKLKNPRTSTEATVTVPQTQVITTHRVPVDKSQPLSAQVRDFSALGGQFKAASSSSRGHGAFASTKSGAAILKAVSDKSQLAKAYLTMSGGSTTSTTASMLMEREKRVRRAKRKEALATAPGRFLRLITRRGG
ncbi:uncharacterized protein L3040_002097 [Drepanopeziza brunnea f. sp. 'multigermtubi']|uniref:Uncharacterized protein n=1 Tax=Marssonina brunnea f. sp. multigermtubi (strain MB_m1) TaxID=1072389 RepID=K1X127_MARBU|nr:uncharacterized protein MBM_02914 [Drepanopeziza brunnea f. sp. 'multigermtubi' MB_m1]EKD18672.1 hypothetical protein MBM_02914 [Drepanopeziza brunnea f. sp. 'multigermtubi' MB_m1]KAJ5052346.1 hypothetical protein L3040_002097 [Drepanopeziza brunnea f. sp. 'multigermtubi']